MIREAFRSRFGARRLDAPRRPQRFAAHYDPEAFGQVSEGIARLFGTARYLVIQTALVAVWIGISFWLGIDDNPRLFLLNLIFSTQAAYAAPLILLAQNRQAERDRRRSGEDRSVNERSIDTAEFLARELAATRLSVGKIEATLARIEDRLDRLEEEQAEIRSAAAGRAPAPTPTPPA